MGRIPLIDGHLDLAWNALSYDRDQTHTIQQLRSREAAIDQPDRGHATVCLPEMRHTGVAVCFASLLARAKPNATPTQSPSRTDIDFANQSTAYATAQGQLAYYRLLEAQGHIKIIHDTATLDDVWSRWANPVDTNNTPIGVVLAMEGADPIVEPDQAHEWWCQGLRAASLAHYGQGIYAHGTTADKNAPGLTPQGKALLQQFEKLGVMLDLTHTSDASFFETLDLYHGPVFASHTNCRALTPSARQFSDEQIQKIIERDGVIGCVLEISMLHHGDPTSQLDRSAVGLETAADHIDHICQLAGNTNHTAIGSDLDGGFGTQRCPHDLDTIADLAKLEPILTNRGYTQQDIAAVFHNNWLRLLRRGLPDQPGTVHPAGMR